MEKSKDEKVLVKYLGLIIQVNGLETKIGGSHNEELNTEEIIQWLKTSLSLYAVNPISVAHLKGDGNYHRGTIEIKAKESGIDIHIPEKVIIRAAEGLSHLPITITDKKGFIDGVANVLEHGLSREEGGLTGFQLLLDDVFYSVAQSGLGVCRLEGKSDKRYEAYEK